MTDLSVAVVSLEIPFHDVDSYRVVWHGNYPRYLEIARCKLLDQLNISYGEMESMGFFYPVVDMNIKYLRSLTFGQVVDVTATLVDWRHKLTIKYVITDHSSGERLTKAKTTQVAVSPEGVIQYDAPQQLIDRVERALAK